MSLENACFYDLALSGAYLPVANKLNQINRGVSANCMEHRSKFSSAMSVDCKRMGGSSQAFFFPLSFSSPLISSVICLQQIAHSLPLCFSFHLSSLLKLAFSLLVSGHRSDTEEKAKLL